MRPETCDFPAHRWCRGLQRFFTACGYEDLFGGEKILAVWGKHKSGRAPTSLWASGFARKETKFCLEKKARLLAKMEGTLRQVELSTESCGADGVCNGAFRGISVAVSSTDLSVLVFHHWLSGANFFHFLSWWAYDDDSGQTEREATLFLLLRETKKRSKEKTDSTLTLLFVVLSFLFGFLFMGNGFLLWFIIDRAT